MQRPVGDWNFRKPEVTYTRYIENIQWNQPPRPHLRGNIQQNCDYQHWCETCDKGFPTAHFLENHKLQHQKCNIDGCQFVAHPKIITKHIQMQHSTGLFKKIAKLNNPEDIKKWREERKRKYPTLENTRKKEAEIKEKINRGEKMGMKYDKGKRCDKGRRNDKTDFQHKSNQRLSHGAKQQRKYNQNIPNNNKRVSTDVIKNSHLPKKICKNVPSMEETRTLKPFAGTQSLQRDDDDLDEKTGAENHYCVPIEDDEDIHNVSDTVQNETTVSEPAVCSALTSLMCCYGSSDEDDIETNSQGTDIKKPLNNNKVKAEEINNKDKISSQNRIEHNSEINKVQLLVSESNVPNCQVATDNESGPEEMEISKEETSLPIDHIKIPKTKLTKELSSKKINRPTSKKFEFRKRSKLPSTLLEKLLHREIQHERNVILQCVRYVVKNKYFENK